MSKGFTIFLGAAKSPEVWSNFWRSHTLAAAVDIDNAGAIQKKKFRRRTGFWGDQNKRMELRNHAFCRK